MTAMSTVVDPLLLPVGLFVGTFHDATTADLHHEVRRGARTFDLSDQEFEVWTMAHQHDDRARRPEASADAPWTRPDFEWHLTGLGIAQPGAIVDRLFDRSLLAEVDSDGHEAMGFARSHRAVPTMYGLGNSPEQPWLYSIGLLGQELMQVTRPVFELWAWSHVDGDLWRACESFAIQEREAGSTDAALCDPIRVLEGFISTLRGLLSVQAVYLDEVGP
jgi:hypothetical protein